MTINFSLPFFIQNLNFNNFLKQYLKKYPEKARFLNSSIDSVYGNFAWTYWNGGINNNNGKISLYNDIFMINNQSHIPIQLNCSNIFLENNDLYDTHMNVIFKLLENNGNLIELSNIQFYEFLSKKYPGYDYILSSNADLIHPFDENILNIIISQNVFKQIILPERLSLDNNFNTNLKNKNKYKIIILSKFIHNNLSKEQEFILQEQKNQSLFSEKSIYSTCDFLKTDIDIKKEIELIQYYISLGFSNFIIDEQPLYNLTLLNNNIIQLLIKEEYQLNFIQEMEKNIYDKFYASRII